MSQALGPPVERSEFSRTVLLRASILVGNPPSKKDVNGHYWGTWQSSGTKLTATGIAECPPWNSESGEDRNLDRTATGHCYTSLLFRGFPVALEWAAPKSPEVSGKTCHATKCHQLGWGKKTKTKKVQDPPPPASHKYHCAGISVHFQWCLWCPFPNGREIYLDDASPRLGLRTRRASRVAVKLCLS